LSALCHFTEKRFHFNGSLNNFFTNCIVFHFVDFTFIKYAPPFITEISSVKSLADMAGSPFLNANSLHLVLCSSHFSHFSELSLLSSLLSPLSPLTVHLSPLTSHRSPITTYLLPIHAYLSALCTSLPTSPLVHRLSPLIPRHSPLPSPLLNHLADTHP